MVSVPSIHVQFAGHQATSSLSLSHEVGRLLKDQESSQRLIAAIGTSVVVIKDHGIGIA